MRPSGYARLIILETIQLEVPQEAPDETPSRQLAAEEQLSAQQQEIAMLKAQIARLSSQTPAPPAAPRSSPPIQPKKLAPATGSAKVVHSDEPFHSSTADYHDIDPVLRPRDSDFVDLAPRAIEDLDSDQEQVEEVQREKERLAFGYDQRELSDDFDSDGEVVPPPEEEDQADEEVSGAPVEAPPIPQRLSGASQYISTSKQAKGADTSKIYFYADEPAKTKFARPTIPPLRPSSSTLSLDGASLPGLDSATPSSTPIPPSEIEFADSADEEKDSKRPSRSYIEVLGPITFAVFSDSALEKLTWQQVAFVRPFLGGSKYSEAKKWFGDAWKELVGSKTGVLSINSSRVLASVCISLHRYILPSDRL